MGEEAAMRTYEVTPGEGIEGLRVVERPQYGR